MFGRSSEDANVYIFQSEVQAMAGEAKRFPDIETGGDLYGTFTHGNMPVIWLASGPGPKAKHFPMNFEQDVRFINHWQSRLLEEFGLQYVGSWHSHHTIGLDHPSGGDMRAAKNYALNHGRRRTLEIIANHEGGRKQVTTLRPYFYPDAQLGGWVPASFTTLRDESPLRMLLGAHEERFSNGLDWRNVPKQSYSLRTSSARSAVDIACQNEGSGFPVELEGAIGRLECEGIEVEERGDFFMLTIPAGEDQVLAVAIKNAGGLNVVQVNFIDRGRGINENIMPRMIEAGIPMSIQKNQLNVLRDVFFLTRNSIGV
jgi:hypothetical protein